MKPLLYCPGCNSSLIKKTIPEELNPFKYENCPIRCVVDYFQYYKKSYEETEVDYINFNTLDNKFHVYIYFDHYMYKNLIHVYSNATLRKYGIASVMLKLPLDKYPLDVSNLQSVNEKIATLALFI